MRLTACGIAVLALLAQPADGAMSQTMAAPDIVLTLPRALRAGETAFVEVQVGPIGRREIDVATASGRPLGTISPFGVRAGQDAGTYTLPLPADAIAGGRVVLRLTISQPGGAPRPPTADEVRSVTLRVGAAGR